MKQENQTIPITGPSSGIGKEFAIQLASKGYNLVLVARRTTKLEELAEELRSQHKIKVEIITADLTLRTSTPELKGLDYLVQYIKSNKLTGLINNAGCGSFGYFEELDIESECQMIKLNIEATCVLASAIIPQLKVRRSGFILSVSSIAAFQPLPLMATYSATKAFNFVHSLALRFELAQFGIKVITLCPGPTATEFGGVARVPGTMTGGHRDSVELVVAKAIKAIHKNQAFVIPGIKSFGLSLLSRLIPKTISTYLVLRALLPAYRGMSSKPKL